MHMPIRSKLSRHKTKLGLILAASVAITSIVLFSYSQKASYLDELRNIKTSYTIYAPDRLDDSLSFSYDSIAYSQGILFYDIKSTTTDGTISVSQQLAPTEKIPVELPKTKELQVEAGRAIISRFSDDKTIVTITNQQSILTLNIPFQISDAKLTSTLESFKAVR